MKVIVTGGAGFLGSHVADVVSEAGHDVTVLDLNESTRHRTVRADLGDQGALVAAFSEVDAVCHLAAVGDVYLAAERPALAAHANVVGTANVCTAATAAGVTRVVYASTWEVYGEPRYQPLDESHPTDPEHPYSITKLAGERLAIAHAYAQMKTSVLALRLGTAYGTRMRPNSVFSLFIGRALRGEPLTVQGTGRQGRQFTHARDIGRAFLSALVRGDNGTVYNIVSDELVTVRDLAERVAARIPAQIVTAPARQAEVPSALVSNDRAKAALGWTPEVEFGTGLDELIAVAQAASSSVVVG